MGFIKNKGHLAGVALNLCAAVTLTVSRKFPIQVRRSNL